MRRRLLASTTLIALAAVLILGVPLGIVGARLVRTDATARLEREADAVAAAVQRQISQHRPLDRDDLLSLVRRGDRIVVAIPGRPSFSLGPAVSGRALRVRSGASAGPSVTVVAGAHDVDRRRREVWLLIAGLGVVGTAVAVALALVQSRRVMGPLRGLATTARRLGAGDFSARAGRFGLPEIDAVAAAQDASAARIARLVAQERAFSANVSHQLRTPLTALQLRLAAIRDAPDLDAARAEADAAQAQSERLERTVAELLSMARDERRASSAPLDAAALAIEHASAWRPVFTRAGGRLECLVEPELRVRATPGAIGQAVDVLLENALQHGGGEARLEALARDGTVVLTVSDDGPGVPAHAREEIFERHVSLTGGTGLGLAVARALVESDGGTLSLAGNQPARFEIALRADDRAER
jgi:signal transduction histidine kinase